MAPELPPSIKVLLMVEAAKRSTSPEDLLNDILMGRNPLPKHVSDLIRAAWNAERRWAGGAE